MPEVIKIELASVKDLVRLAYGLRYPIIYKYKGSDSNYLMIIYGTGGNIIVPYVKLEEEIEGEYIVYDTMSGNYRISDSFSTNPKELSMAIVSVKKQPLI